jgi:signal transduction histidine kinase
VRLFPKLALTVLSLLILTCALLAGCFYWSEQRQIRLEIGQQEQGILDNLVHIAQESFLSNDDLLLVKYVGWLRNWNSDIVSASIVETHGEIRAHSEPDRIGKKMTDKPGGSDVLLFSQPVYLGHKWLGTASIAFSAQAIEKLIKNRLHHLKLRICLACSLCGILGVAAAFLFAMTLARPVNHLSTAMRNIASGEWSPNLHSIDMRKDEIGALAASLKAMAARLGELDRMKEDFVSAVTHELRSPLGAIESYLRLMREEKPAHPPDEWPLYLERMEFNTQRLTRFVNDLLDVAALERGKIQMKRRPVDLAVLIKEVMQLFDAKLRECSLAVSLEFGSGLPEVSADGDKIRQVLINFVSNAIKFTPSGGRITVSAKQESDKAVIVRVADTGLGISPSDQEKLFNKFEQVREARLQIKGPKGTGLGLAISRALVEMHGGHVGVSSEPGKGSIFYFTLPVENAESRVHSLLIN